MRRRTQLTVAVGDVVGGGMAVHVTSVGDAHSNPMQHSDFAPPPLAPHVSDFPPSPAQVGLASLRRS